MCQLYAPDFLNFSSCTVHHYNYIHQIEFDLFYILRKCSTQLHKAAAKILNLALNVNT